MAAEPHHPGFKITYARVEAALVRVHGIVGGDVLAARARYGTLQRGGLLGDAARPARARAWMTGPTSCIGPCSASS